MSQKASSRSGTSSSTATDLDRVGPAAAAVFGSRLPLAVRYAELLATEGVVRGLIGPREVARLWTRHLLNCAAIEELVPPAARVIDVGSGAGLPGVPLALARPDLTVVLLEPMQRRTAFLDECVSLLSLADVSVVRSRAQEQHGKLTAAVVTARAVAPLPALLHATLPLVEPGGVVLAMKGRSAAAEVAAATRELRRWDAVAEVRTCGVGTLEEPTTVVRIHRLAGPHSRRTRRERGPTS